MAVCPQCRSEIREHAILCPICGSEVSGGKQESEQITKSTHSRLIDVLLSGIIATLLGGFFALASVSLGISEIVFIVSWIISFYFLFQKSSPSDIVLTGLYLISFLIFMRFVLGGVYASLQREDGVLGGLGGMIFLSLLTFITVFVLMNLNYINDDIY